MFNSVKLFVTLVIACSFLASCETISYQQVPTKQAPPISKVFVDQPVEASVALATAQVLQHTIKDPDKKEVVADYVNVYAEAVRTITGTPSPAELNAEIDKWIPAKVKAQHPEIVAIGKSIIVKQYQKYWPKIEANPKAEKVINILNKIATGLDYGTAGLTTNAKVLPPPVPTPGAPIIKVSTTPTPSPTISPVTKKHWWQF